MKPRTLLQLASMHQQDMADLIAEFMGINAEPQAGCRLDWLHIESEPILVESEQSEDYGGAPMQEPTNALVNGEWVSAGKFGIDTIENWRDELSQIVKRERESARAQEAA